MIGGFLAGFEEIVGIEQDETYVSIGRRRMAWWTGYTPEVMGSKAQGTPAVPETPRNAQLTLF